MKTIFNIAFVLTQAQDWLAGNSDLTLKQLDTLYRDATDALLGPDVTPNVRCLLDDIDQAYAQIIAEVSA